MELYLLGILFFIIIGAILLLYWRLFVMISENEVRDHTINELSSFVRETLARRLDREVLDLTEVARRLKNIEDVIGTN